MRKVPKLLCDLVAIQQALQAQMGRPPALIQSVHNNRIIAVVLPLSINGWDACKLTEAGDHKSEAPYGALFNCTDEKGEKLTPQWRVLTPAHKEYMVGMVAFVDWIIDDCPMADYFSID